MVQHIIDWWIEILSIKYLHYSITKKNSSYCNIYIFVYLFLSKESSNLSREGSCLEIYTVLLVQLIIMTFCLFLLHNVLFLLD